MEGRKLAWSLDQVIIRLNSLMLNTHLQCTALVLAAGKVLWELVRQDQANTSKSHWQGVEQVALLTLWVKLLTGKRMQKSSD